MDYFVDVLATFLGFECGKTLAMEGQKALEFHKNILICVPKMNECLTCL